MSSALAALVRVNSSAYALRWVGDALCYRRVLLAVQFAYRPRQRWVGDAPAYNDTPRIKEGSLEGLQHQEPTSDEVGMTRHGGARRLQHQYHTSHEVGMKSFRGGLTAKL
jgi:hypothetical protein